MSMVILRRFGRADRRTRGVASMSKFGGFFTRKGGLDDQAAEAAGLSFNPSPAAAENTLELDEELFTALGAQMGGENELLRNLLLDAHAKIGELDIIKASVGRLVDPVSKALRAFEAEKSEKAGLQTVLSTTRTAYGKLRNEAGEMEKRAAAAEKECQALRQELAATEAALRTTEAAKSELAIDGAARRVKNAELEGRLTQETGESKMLREENRRYAERQASLDRRVITLDADFNTTRQRLIMAEDEKQVQQAAFEKASAEAARLSRKLVEAEASLNTAHGRLRNTEATCTELNSERARLNSALDEANERHDHEIATQRMRFETLQARAAATEKLLVEAREHLLGRAEDVRDYDRRNSDLTRERDSLQARLGDLETERSQREAQFHDVEQARATMMERGASLTRAFASKESALAQAEETIAARDERIAALEALLSRETQAAEQAIEDLTAALRREKVERAVAEGALESGRKDFARLMRDLMALQRGQQAAEEPAPLRPANAA
jgi:chromosome segregation ATPase